MYNSADDNFKGRFQKFQTHFLDCPEVGGSNGGHHRDLTGEEHPEIPLIIMGGPNLQLQLEVGNLMLVAKACRLAYNIYKW